MIWLKALKVAKGAKKAKSASKAQSNDIRRTFARALLYNYDFGKREFTRLKTVDDYATDAMFIFLVIPALRAYLERFISTDLDFKLVSVLPSRINVERVNKGSVKIFSEDELKVFEEGWNTKSTVATYKIGETSDRVVMDLSKEKFTLPVNAAINSKYGYRPSFGRFHYGVDQAAPTGTPVKVAFDGMVRFAGQAKGYGNVVIVRHRMGLETVYGHLSKISVRSNDWLNSGDILGEVGSTGVSTGAHLHFEVRYRNRKIDPQWLIDYKNKSLRDDIFILKQEYLQGAQYSEDDLPTKQEIDQFRKPASKDLIVENFTFSTTSVNYQGNRGLVINSH